MEAGCGEAVVPVVPAVRLFQLSGLSSFQVVPVFR
jgi:hypothetical protein